MLAKSIIQTLALVLVAVLLNAQELPQVVKPKALRVQMTSCDLKAERPLSMKALFSSQVKITRRGAFDHKGEEFWIFLPNRWSHRIENSEDSSDSFQNDSSYFYVNQRKDRKLTVNESWFCNLPFRVGDDMFRVTAIDKDGDWIEIQKVNVPVSGIVIGRPLPEFAWPTMSGEIVTNKSFLGKYLVIDIWSPT